MSPSFPPSWVCDLLSLYPRFLERENLKTQLKQVSNRTCWHLKSLFQLKYQPKPKQFPHLSLKVYFTLVCIIIFHPLWLAQEFKCTFCESWGILNSLIYSFAAHEGIILFSFLIVKGISHWLRKKSKKTDRFEEVLRIQAANIWNQL